MKHRVISLILVLVLAVGLMPVVARAAEGDWRYEKIEGGLRLTGYLGTEQELTLPDTLAGKPVIEIGAGCFRESDVTKVTIPHGIRVIGDEAFYRCAALKKVNLSGSVNVIGTRAFAKTGLIKMDIPGSVRSIGDEAFYGCTGMYNVVIEEGVEEWSLDIGEGFGSGSVMMEEGVESIGSRAFYGCANLTRMRVPASVKTIGSQAIGYTDAGKQISYQLTGYKGSAAEAYAGEHGLSFKALESKDGLGGICGLDIQWSWEPGTRKLSFSGTGRMYDYASAEYLPWYRMRSSIQTVEVGEGITSVSEYAFDGSGVTEVILPESLHWIGKGSFADCDKLDELTFTGSAPVFAADGFQGTVLTAWYPGADASWTPGVRQNYGGSITWRRMGGLPFVDVPVGSFFYDPVAWALDMGITTGTDATHFSPEDKCQRAAVVTFLWRAAGSPEPVSGSDPFDDVKPSDFYYKAVLWAVEKGITNGLDNTHFGPYEFCNRAQVATFLWRAAGSPDPGTSRNPFGDVKAKDFYYKAVLWAVEKGITNGMEPTVFGPEEICNRAQIVTFLYRAKAD